MHKLFEYLCDELKAIEKKVESGQTLSMNEIEYAHKLTDMKKNLLKIEMLEEGSAEYSGARDGYRVSNRMMYDDRGGVSYARGRRGGVKRDAMGRYSSEGYSRAEDDFMAELRELMHDAPDDHKRQKIQALISDMERM